MYGVARTHARMQGVRVCVGNVRLTYFERPRGQLEECVFTVVHTRSLFSKKCVRVCAEQPGNRPRAPSACACVRVRVIACECMRVPLNQ